MIDSTCFTLRAATEHQARATLTGPGLEPHTGAWELYGPTCVRARTLPASYPVEPLPGPHGVAWSLFVPDPCFWSPELPFLYELRPVPSAGRAEHSLRGEALDADGGAHAGASAAEGRHWLGFSRLEPHRDHLRRDGRRIVLRGVQLACLDEQSMRDAIACEAVVCTPLPDAALLAAASREGLPLVVDLRVPGGCQGEEPGAVQGEAPREGGRLSPLAPLARLLGLVSWHPAVAAVVLRAEQLDALPAGLARPRTLLLGQSLAAASPAALHPAADLIVVEVAAGARPALAFAGANRPLVVLRSDPCVRPLAAGRQASDRLQAELSPEFDAAGYFACSAL